MAVIKNMERNQDLYHKFEDYPPPCPTKVTLKNKELWKRFNEMETEMIITKSGRRMFPTLQVGISGLDPHAQYCIFLELAPASHCRYKYSNSGGWAPTGAEEAQNPQRFYIHPDSPCTGEYLMSQPVSFGRLKLTNTPAPPVGHVVLSSMHKYQPRILIAKTSDPRTVAWSPSVTVAFPETQFIAVTAYQNEKITKLKIDNNPFAKGFRETGQSKSKRKKISETTEEEPPIKISKPERIDLPKPEDCRISVPSPSSNSSNHSSSSISPIQYPVPSPDNQTIPPRAIYPYYWPQYPVYSPFCHRFPHYYYQLTPLSYVAAPIEGKSKKLTDFSIKAIMEH